MRVFLIHGMGRTRLSLLLLAGRLRRAGHDVTTFGYLVSRIASSPGGTDAPFALVGHSLGNVIGRLALPRLPGLTHFAMLAPPNQPPALARIFQASPVFRALTRDAGARLADPGFYADLPVPSCRTLIIAGTSGPRGSWTPWEGRPTDGVVGVEETLLPGVPVVEVAAVHTFIMNDSATATLLRTFFGEDAAAAG
jgi:hypothetical protein